jgi:hypothetical protein
MEYLNSLAQLLAVRAKAIKTYSFQANFAHILLLMQQKAVSTYYILHKGV